MNKTEQKEIQAKFPFLSCVRHSGNEHVCVIQNTDERILTYYCFHSLNSVDEQRLFLEFGDIWWGESNRQLPINIFLRQEMEQFKYCLRTVSVKDVEVLFGPVTSLNDLFKKRIKRRQIQLIRKN